MPRAQVPIDVVWKAALAVGLQVESVPISLFISDPQSYPEAASLLLIRQPSGDQL
jgi:hypothetical protein